MSSSSAPQPDSASQNINQDPNPPTVAQFSPTTLPNSSNLASRRSTILVHQKSPLLVATPPQVTRALAYSHPFLLPLNKAAGLLSWTSDDPWESFLVVAGFWAILIYGDTIIRWAGPVVVVTALIAGMYLRRYSPLSSTGWSGEKGTGKQGHKRENSESNTRHHKSLDEILDTLKVFTSRCNVLLDPFIEFTDFLSTQRTATSATTRPALTSLFLRILLVTPFWIGLTAPPLHIITTKRVLLTTGTLILTWHSRPARVSRTILWRSSTVRRLCSSITGLTFGPVVPKPKVPKITKTPSSQPGTTTNVAVESLGAKRRPGSPGVRFTFTLYENQRRWLGIGWTNSMFAYERAPWTDEHLNAAHPKEEFTLPEVDDENSRWRWVHGGEWRVEGAGEGEEGGPKGTTGESKAGNGGGWIYYDNKWRDGRRGQDSWGRYTRRRKWYRDAELVEVTASTEVTPSPTPNPSSNPDAALSESESKDPLPPLPPPESLDSKDFNTDDDGTSSMKKRKWFKARSRRSSRNSSMRSGSFTGSDRDRDERGDDPRLMREEREEEWGLGDDARMGLG